jgi:hypothetical protein
MIKSLIEQQFTQNLLYMDALQKRQMTTLEIQKKLESLNNKINEKK